MIWVPPEREMLLILSAIFSTYSISFNLNNIAFSSISLAVFNRLLADAVSSRLMITLACAFLVATMNCLNATIRERTYGSVLRRAQDYPASLQGYCITFLN